MLIEKHKMIALVMSILIHSYHKFVSKNDFCIVGKVANHRCELKEEWQLWQARLNSVASCMSDTSRHHACPEARDTKEHVTLKRT